jgi:hypothetical protein
VLAILDGKFTAKSSDCPGIGSGFPDSSNSSVQNLIVLDGDITATAGLNATRIGSRHVYSRYSIVMTLMLVNGTFSEAGSRGAGIG